METPAALTDAEKAARVIERVVNNAVFVHGSADHPQFLHVDVESVEVKLEKQGEGKAPASQKETLTLKFRDSHLKNIPADVRDQILKSLVTLPALKELATFEGETACEDKPFPNVEQCCPDAIQITFTMRPGKAKEVIQQIGALDPTLGKEKSKEPVAFGTVDSVQIVGASSAEALKAAQTALFGQAQVSHAATQQPVDISPFAERIVSLVREANQTIEQAERAAVGLPAGVPATLPQPGALPSPVVHGAHVQPAHPGCFLQ